MTSQGVSEIDKHFGSIRRQCNYPQSVRRPTIFKRLLPQWTSKLLKLSLHERILPKKLAKYGLRDGLSQLYPRSTSTCSLMFSRRFVAVWDTSRQCSNAFGDVANEKPLRNCSHPRAVPFFLESVDMEEWENASRPASHIYTSMFTIVCVCAFL